MSRMAVATVAAVTAMAPIHVCSKTSVGAGQFSPAAKAGDPPTPEAIDRITMDELAADQMSVRELMRLDTDLALSDARNRLRELARGRQGAEQPGGMAQSGSLKLVSIYGVGKNLLAEVAAGSRNYVYMRGQPGPIGQPADASLYQLRGINGSCVQLERGQESHTLCLRPSLWTAK